MINSWKLKQIKIQRRLKDARQKIEVENLMSEIGLEIKSMHKLIQIYFKKTKGWFTIDLSVCVIVKVFVMESALDLLLQRLIWYFRSQLDMMWKLKRTKTTRTKATFDNHKENKKPLVASVCSTCFIAPTFQTLVLCRFSGKHNHC